jgi:hypothetical protein
VNLPWPTAGTRNRSQNGPLDSQLEANREREHVERILEVLKPASKDQLATNELVGMAVAGGVQ